MPRKGTKLRRLWSLFKCEDSPQSRQLEMLSLKKNGGLRSQERARYYNLLLVILALGVLFNYEYLQRKLKDDKTTPSSSRRNVREEKGTLFDCDVSDYRTDVCYLRGDVRVNGKNSTVVLLLKQGGKDMRRKVRPYTRKWEPESMQTVRELTLLTSRSTAITSSCDVRHSVPGVVFSTGGYSGSLFHDFTDGLVPLFITSQRFKGEVVFLITEHKSWWVKKYHRILQQLSHYPVVNLDTSLKVHCFPDMVVGLRNHGDLQIRDGSKMDGSSRIQDFQGLLKKALGNNTSQDNNSTRRPRLVFMARNESRVLVNENATLDMARRIGFQVEVLSPGPKTDLSVIYGKVNSAQVLMGVHGAALTHFLFLEPGSVLIQIVPLGLVWPSKTYFGKSAPKAGIKYLEYKVLPSESTLEGKFGRNHSLIKNSDEALTMGWWELKKVYLDDQDILLSLTRFQKVLQKAFKECSLKDPLAYL